ARRAAGRRRRGRDSHRRRRRRDSLARSREDLPAVFHDQGARVRDRAVDGLSDRADARRPDRRRIRSGPWDRDDADASSRVRVKRHDVAKRALLGASALLVLSGCATDQAAVKKPVAPPPTASPAPQPTPAPQTSPAPQPSPGSQPVSIPPSRSPAPAPAGPLRPEVPPAEEQRLLESTRQNIADVARTLGELEGRALKPPQQESL